MKTIIKLFTLLFVVGFALSTTAWGQLLTEDFDYTAGDSLNVLHGWVVQPTASYVNTIIVVSPGLTYTDYVSASGNAAKIDTTGQDIYKTFTSQTSGSLYASFLVNIAKATTTGDYFFHFTESAGSTTFRGRVFAKLSGSEVMFGLLKGSTGTASYTTATYAMNTTHLVVLKYTFNTGSTTDDSVYLFINPALTGSEPTPDLRYGSTDLDFTGCAAINLRQGTAANAPRLTLDGIRVGTTWNDAPLPIQLASFEGRYIGSSAELVWKTISEINNYGFNVQRLNETSKNFETIGFVAGNGHTSTPQSYSYIDDQPGNTYRLEQIDNDGLKSYFGPINLKPNSVDDNSIPLVFKLNQNYPNPFNPTTNITFSLDKSGYTFLKVYNVLGNEVATLFNGNADAGKLYNVNFDAKNLSTGIYIYKLQSGSNVEVKKLTLVK